LVYLNVLNTCSLCKIVNALLVSCSPFGWLSVQVFIFARIWLSRSQSIDYILLTLTRLLNSYELGNGYNIRSYESIRRIDEETNCINFEGCAFE